MTILGKEIRMERILNRNTGKTVIVPMDHGVTVGPIPGIVDIREAVDLVAMGGANAVVAHKGVVGKGHRKSGADIGLIVHLSASTAMSPTPHAKTIVCSVEEAVKMGADAVSVHVNIGNGDEKEMLRDFGRISYDARTWGMPLMAMMYPRGEAVENEYDTRAVAHAARIGAEMGADIVKVSYTGCPESFRKVVDGCDVPVVIAGGPKMSSDREILEMVEGAVLSGGAGVSMGRNIFQHDDPGAIVKAVSGIVNEGAGVDESLEVLVMELKSIRSSK